MKHLLALYKKYLESNFFGFFVRLKDMKLLLIRLSLFQIFEINYLKQKKKKNNFIIKTPTDNCIMHLQI